jgi:hypothetical protein
VGGLCSCFFGRFGVFGHDTGVCRVSCMGGWTTCMMMAFGRVRRGGSCVRPLSKYLTFVPIKGGNTSPLTDKNTKCFWQRPYPQQGGGGPPHLFAPPRSPFTKHATTASPSTLPPPSPPFLLSFLSRVHSLGLLRPCHVILPHQHPSNTTIPVCMPRWPPVEHHINHHEPPLLTVRAQCYRA